MTARSIFEFGLGTGRFAAKLLAGYLHTECRYVGTDVSSTMIDLATQRLHRWASRAAVHQSLSSTAIPAPDCSVDRFFSIYVLDLLPEQDIVSIVQEAYRILSANGLICLVSLTNGKRLVPRMVSTLWDNVYRLNSRLVGGCRPIELTHFVSSYKWEIRFHDTVEAFGITSEVMVAGKLPGRYQDHKASAILRTGGT